MVRSRNVWRPYHYVPEWSIDPQASAPPAFITPRLGDELGLASGVVLVSIVTWMFVGPKALYWLLLVILAGQVLVNWSILENMITGGTRR